MKLLSMVIDGVFNMAVLKSSNELQRRDTAIGTDFHDLLVEHMKLTLDRCLHRVGKTLKICEWGWGH